MILGCLFLFLAVGAPRLALFLMWLARPEYFQAAFSSTFVACLGFLFVPFTTLMYALVYTPGVGLTGLDWLWVALAFVLDIGGYAGSYGNRKQYMPA
jgi:hypothetical protein